MPSDYSPSLAIIITSIIQGVRVIERRHNDDTLATLFLTRFSESVSDLIANSDLSDREKSNVYKFSDHLFSAFQIAPDFFDDDS